MKFRICYTTPGGEEREVPLESNEILTSEHPLVISTVLSELQIDVAIEPRNPDDRRPAPKLDAIERDALEEAGAKILRVILIQRS